jgi:hypothetical protein
MATTPNFESSTLRGFGGLGQPKPEKKDEPSKPHEGGKQQPPQSRAAQPRQATDPLVALSTNYSVAPGPAWLLLTNPADITAAGALAADIPIHGAGDLFAKLQLPIAVAVIPPKVAPPGAAPGPFASSAQKKNGEKPEAKAGITPAAITITELQPQFAGMPVENQSRQQVDQQALEAYNADIASGIPQILALQPLTPEQQALTGMSPSGFPGIVPGLGTSNALPTTLGIQGATIDVTTSPPTLTITTVGTGTIPANSRWLVFTIIGV